MAEVKTEEPSIEEILESIRQIISEDTDTEAKPAVETKLEVVKPAAVPPSDLSLTPKAEAPVAPSNLSLTPKAEAPLPPAAPLSLTPDIAKPVEKAAPLDLTQALSPATPAAPVKEEVVEIDMMDSPMTQDKSSSLVSNETANAVTDSLSKLLAQNVAVEEEVAGRVGKVTLEDMTRELMKPLVKTWLDQNLPGIIEKVVQKEVEKLSRRALDR